MSIPRPRAAFRIARTGSTSRLAWRTAVQIVVVWGFAHVALPALASRLDARLPGRRPPSPRPPHRRLDPGAALFATASALGLASARVMVRDGGGTPLPLDAAGRLVTGGPYAVVRNPMAVSAVLQTCGLALRRRSPSLIALAMVEVAVWELVLRPAEERFLAETFGADYLRYRAAVPRWLPRRATRSPATPRPRADRGTHHA